MAVDKERLNARAAVIFPYALGAIVPLAGAFLAFTWFVEKRTYDACILLAACALGLVIYLLAFGVI